MSSKLFSPDSVEPLGDFERRALAIAGSVRSAGAGEGTRVLLKAGNSMGYVGALLGLMHAGASIVLLGHEEKAAATARVRRQTGAELVIVDDDSPIAEDGTDDTDGTVIHLQELLVDAAERAPEANRLDVDAWAALPDGLIMWSSGSTGEPKGVVKNGGRFLTNLRRNATRMGHAEDDVLMPLLPFSHQYGLSMVLIAWLARCSLMIAPYRRLDRALLMAGRCGATVVDATPATYRSMLDIIARRPVLRRHLARARMLCSGAAPLAPALSQAYEERFGLPLLDSYGSTELGNLTFATLDDPTACGRPLDGIGVKVVDDDGVALPAGQVGEVMVDSPDMMAGYLDARGKLEPAPQGWYRTNDFGHLDERGNLAIVGRMRAVHRNGYTLHPEVIERRLALAGWSVKIAALADERRGSQLAFFVECVPGRTTHDVREQLAATLPQYEQPNRVILIDRFPLNANGKPDVAALERLAQKEATA